MKKRAKKIRKEKLISKLVMDKKIETEEYIDAVTHMDDNTDARYPFAEGKPLVVKNDKDNS